MRLDWPSLEICSSEPLCPAVAILLLLSIEGSALFAGTVHERKY